MKTYLVVEGPADKAILDPILAALGMTDVIIVPAGGKALISSLARSLVLTRHSPVAAVMDADTTDPSRIRQQAAIFADLTTGSGGATHCRLFQAVPTLEEAIFPTPEDFEEMFSISLPASERQDLARSRTQFIRRWLAKTITGRGNGINVNEAKARRALEGHGLRGLVSYLGRASLDAVAAE